LISFLNGTSGYETSLSAAKELSPQRFQLFNGTTLKQRELGRPFALQKAGRESAFPAVPSLRALHIPSRALQDPGAHILLPYLKFLCRF